MTYAIVFPGQGSQSIGMLGELKQKYSIVSDLLTQASDVLGYDLAEVISEGPVEKLNQTQITQPALLCAGVASWQVIKQKIDDEKIELDPKFMAGHSLGEYSALVCAGVIDFQDAIKLVAERGRLMQEAVPEGIGAMAAILGLDDDKVIVACKDSSQDQVVSAVNFNSPGQVVIAGNKEAVERAMVAAKDAGAKRALTLPVSVPSHCELMLPAAKKLKLVLADIEFKSPRIPVIHNFDVQAHSEADQIRNMLVSQLHQPVQWSKTINTLADQGVDKLVEAGPGKVLTGLTKRITKSMSAQAVYDLTTLDALIES